MAARRGCAAVGGAGACTPPGMRGQDSEGEREQDGREDGVEGEIKRKYIGRARE